MLLPWMVKNIWGEDLKSNKPEVKPPIKVTQCQEEEEEDSKTIETEETNPHSKAMQQYKPQLFSSVDYHTTQLLNQLNNISQLQVLFNQLELLLTDKPER